jgi:hypothetical protein
VKDRRLAFDKFPEPLRRRFAAAVALAGMTQKEAAVAAIEQWTAEQEGIARNNAGYAQAVEKAQAGR